MSRKGTMVEAALKLWRVAGIAALLAVFPLLSALGQEHAAATSEHAASAAPTTAPAEHGVTVAPAHTAEPHAEGTSGAAATPEAAHLEAHSAEAHAAHGGEHEEAESPELPNIISVLLHTKVAEDTYLKDTGFGHFLHTYEKQIFLLFITTLLAVIVFGTLGRRAVVPGRMQAFLELVVEGFYSFITGILGEHNKRYVPFLATLFIFIFANNLSGIIPFMAAPTSKYPTTLALALIVFFYTQYQGIKETGIKHYLHHLAGSPKDIIGYCMAPLMFPLEVIGTLAKPLSLSLRLFGNIMGEDILIGVFLMLGLQLMSVVWPHPLVGVPLHLPFLFLALLTSTIQALVFTMLSTIYLMMLLPHHEHDDHHEEGNWHAEHKLEMPGMPEDPTPHIGADAAPFVG